MYKIKIETLLEEVGTLKEIKDHLSLIDPDNSFELAEPVNIDLTLIGLENSVLLKGTAQVTLNLECARCTQKYLSTLTLNIEEVYKREEDIISFDSSDKELGPEDLYFIIEPDETIDIEELLRQNIIMALPIKPICSINCKPVSLTIGNEAQGKAFADLKNLLDGKGL